MGRILALDYGTKRIGVAISDPAATLALPREPLEGLSDAEILVALTILVEADEVSRVVIGLPRREDGSEGPMAVAVRDFSEQLTKKLTVPIEFMDERLTTRHAKQLLKTAPRKRKGKGRVDTTAALIILQDYLTAQHGN